MATRSALINVMSRAADKAARGLRRDFGEVEQLQVSVKGPGNFVSTADHRAEKVLRQELQHGRPDYSFLMEESGAIAGSRAGWPIDRLISSLSGRDPAACAQRALQPAMAHGCLLRRNTGWAAPA